MAELLASASSRELTEWQAYWQYLEQVQSEKQDGRRKWNEE